MTYRYKVTNYDCYRGCGQSVDDYMVECPYFKLQITHYGNQGFDAPTILHKEKNNGYFSYLRVFLANMYTGHLIGDIGFMKLHEVKDISFEE